MSGTLRFRPLLFAVVIAATALALVLALRPAPSHGALPRIFAFAVPANKGPVTACYTAPCPVESWEQIPIYTANTNPLVNFVNQPGDLNARYTVPNAYVVDSVDWSMTINGVTQPPDTTPLTPPPNAFIKNWAGHWPSTVRCPFDGAPCYVVGHPAVLPGENIAPLYFSWIHGSDEPDGVYVFTFTLHGSVNGAPLDVTTSTPPIQMTR